MKGLGAARNVVLRRSAEGNDEIMSRVEGGSRGWFRLDANHASGVVVVEHREIFRDRGLESARIDRSPWGPIGGDLAGGRTPGRLLRTVLWGR